MPAKSKSQQGLMGAVHAYQKGELKNPSGKVKAVASHISPSDARDFAATKHKGLPMKKKADIAKMANLVTNYLILRDAGIVKDAGLGAPGRASSAAGSSSAVGKPPAVGKPSVVGKPTASPAGSPAPASGLNAPSASSLLSSAGSALAPKSSIAGGAKRDDANEVLAKIRNQRGAGPASQNQSADW